MECSRRVEKKTELGFSKSCKGFSRKRSVLSTEASENPIISTWPGEAVLKASFIAKLFFACQKLSQSIVLLKARGARQEAKYMRGLESRIWSCTCISIEKGLACQSTGAIADSAARETTHLRPAMAALAKK